MSHVRQFPFHLRLYACSYRFMVLVLKADLQSFSPNVDASNMLLAKIGLVLVIVTCYQH